MNLTHIAAAFGEKLKDYYRLTKSYIDKDGKTKHRSVLCLGELPGFDKDERNRLASKLTTMIEDGQSVMYLRENTALAEMFDIEEKILLFDITNSYFEGKMENSELCQYGRSKKKRDDCKIVVLAAVVNTEGLLVRTMIYEGNRHDTIKK